MREIGEAASPSSLTPGSKFIGSQADFLGLHAALMTGLGAGDVGPTGDLQVLVKEPEPDFLPAQVGLETFKCNSSTKKKKKDYSAESNSKSPNPS